MTAANLMLSSMVMESGRENVVSPLFSRRGFIPISILKIENVATLFSSHNWKTDWNRERREKRHTDFYEDVAAMIEEISFQDYARYLKAASNGLRPYSYWISSLFPGIAKAIAIVFFAISCVQ